MHMEQKDSYDNSRSSLCSKKKKIIFIIAVAFASLIIITAIFLIGYLKLGWFKKSDNDTDNDRYDLDVKIKRTVNQVDYFTETKKNKIQSRIYIR